METTKIFYKDSQGRGWQLVEIETKARCFKLNCGKQADYSLELTQKYSPKRELLCSGCSKKSIEFRKLRKLHQVKELY